MSVSTRSSKGFTLLELMLAAAIMIVAILGLLSLLINCMVLNDSNKNLVVAANDAQYVLEQMKGLTYDNINNYTAPNFTNLDNETINLARSIGAQIAEVSVNVSWTGRQRNRSFILSTRIAR